MKSGTVAIVGRPNSGKSTLLNALIGQKISIVSENPQTTRYRILGILTETRGQIAWVDTPGIHKPNYNMNRRMLHTTRASLVDVDLVLLVVDSSISFGAGESFALEMVKRAGPKAFLLLNKIDKVAKPVLLPIIERYRREHDFLEIIPLSALKGEKLSLLLDKVFEHLPNGALAFDPNQLTDRTERFLTAEFIREKVLDHTRAELPYTTAVIIRRFDESQRTGKQLVVIQADILVEKRSQQGIILGAGGSNLRDVGAAARRDLERLLGCRIYLDLTVRTVPKWRNSDTVLDQLELGE